MGRADFRVVGGRLGGTTLTRILQRKPIPMGWKAPKDERRHKEGERGEDLEKAAYGDVQGTHQWRMTRWSLGTRPENSGETKTECDLVRRQLGVPSSRGEGTGEESPTEKKGFKKSSRWIRQRWLIMERWQLISASGQGEKKDSGRQTVMPLANSRHLIFMGTC